MNWKLVSDGLILISFKSNGVFPAVFSVAGLGWWERGIPSSGRFWMAALVSSCHVSRCAWHPPRPLQHLQGCSRYTPQAGLQQTPRGGFGQTQPARTAAESQSPALLEPAGSTIHLKQPELCWLQPWAGRGTEITQRGSILWDSTHIHTSASVTS